MFNGILLVDKPVNWTSFDVIAKIRGIVSRYSQIKVKVGHSGTLDPFASGLLIILLGSYTKRAEELTKLDKVYEVSLKLGETTTTGDPEGTITNVSNKVPSQESIESILKKMSGELMQTPPAFSAIKIGGQRAYKLARAGESPKLEPRRITIYSNKLVTYKYPVVRFVSHVSSGTYIRTLVDDIGKDLKVGAYCVDLRRITISGYDVAQAINISDCNAENILRHLIINS